MAASNVFGSMPSPPPTGNGIYDVTATSGPYSQKLRAVDRVGTAQYPFLPSCQPAYIPVLYRNVGTINDTLIDINTTVSGHTTTLGTIDTTVSGHTTTLGTINTSITNINTSIGTANITGSITAAIAILQTASSTGSSSCSTQFLGTTASVITGVTISSDYIVDVSSNTTVISSISTVSTSVRATYTYTNGGVQNPDAAIAIYEMAAYDSKEVGCSKTVMFTAANWVNGTNYSDGVSTDSGHLAFLYAGTGNYFLVNGSKQNFYQFSFIGDFVTFQMLTTDGSTWQFVVTTNKSILSTTISLNNAQASVNVTDETLRALIVILQ